MINQNIHGWSIHISKMLAFCCMIIGIHSGCTGQNDSSSGTLQGTDEKPPISQKPVQGSEENDIDPDSTVSVSGLRDDCNTVGLAWLSRYGCVETNGRPCFENGKTVSNFDWNKEFTQGHWVPFNLMTTTWADETKYAKLANGTPKDAKKCSAVLDLFSTPGRTLGDFKIAYGIKFYFTFPDFKYPSNISEADELPPSIAIQPRGSIEVNSYESNSHNDILRTDSQTFPVELKCDQPCRIDKTTRFLSKEQIPQIPYSDFCKSNVNAGGMSCLNFTAQYIADACTFVIRHAEINTWTDNGWGGFLKVRSTIGGRFYRRKTNDGLDHGYVLKVTNIELE